MTSARSTLRHLDPGVAATLAELRRRGARLGIVTNGAASVQNATLDAALFHRAAKQLGVRPDECCFVGDHPTVDIAGAEAAGLRAVWKRTPYWMPPVATIDAIPELLSLALE